MFVILYLISHYMQPEGLWQRFCRCSRATAGFSNYNPFLPRTSLRRHSEASHTPSPHVGQTKEKKRGHKRKGTFCLSCPASSTPAQAQTPTDLHSLHLSPRLPKPYVGLSSRGPWPPTLVVGKAISYCAAPVLPIPHNGVGPQVPPM